MRNVPDLVAEMRALLAALADSSVEYALCVGLAANIYGADRFTKDIDLLVAPDNLQSALAVAKKCGFDLEAGTYAAAYEFRYAVSQEDLQLWLVALEELIAMKRESGRPIDQQDVERLS